MSDRCEVPDFLNHFQQDKKLAREILEAISKGGMITAEAVMQVAKKAGYSSSREDFERTVRSDIIARYRAGEHKLAATVNANDPPESSCA